MVLSQPSKLRTRVRFSYPAPELSDQTEFRKHFWEWFDSLPPKTRKTFHEYPLDMATLYFENKVWPLVRGSCSDGGRAPDCKSGT